MFNQSLMRYMHNIIPMLCILSFSLSSSGYCDSDDETLDPESVRQILDQESFTAKPTQPKELAKPATATPIKVTKEQETKSEIAPAKINLKTAKPSSQRVTTLQKSEHTIHNEAQELVQSKRHKIVSLKGQALNVTVNTADQVKLTIYKLESGVLIAEGSFGPRRLVGNFSVPGRELRQCARRHSCLFFSGMLNLGGAGGWPEGTGTTFSMTLAISPSEQISRGVYHIGNLPTLNVPQYGRLDLHVDEH
jgi:hypothetical protein